MLKKFIVFFLFISSVIFLQANELESKSLTYFIKSENSDKIVVTLNAPILNNLEKTSSFFLHISEENSIEFRMKSIKKRKNGSIQWSGIHKEKKAKVLITYLNGILFAEIKLGKEIYKLMPKGKNTSQYIIFKEDTSKRIKFKNDIQIPIIKPKVLKIKGEISSDTPENITSFDNEIKLQLDQPRYEKSLVNGNTILDVMILYTGSFLDHYGGATQTRIQYLLDLANEGLENSQTSVVLNLAHTQLFDDDLVGENNSIYDSLTNLTNHANVMALKRKYDVDIVSLFRRYDGVSGVCGLGYLLDNLSTSSARSSSFNVVEDRQGSEGGYSCSDKTFIHEVGHNLGCAHDRDHASGSGIFSYSYGYDMANEFATIMSYDSPEINYFSSPELTYDSLPIGVSEGNSNSADNARTIRETKYYVDNQYLEELENAEQITGNTIQGILSNKDDRDLFRVRLSGEVTFSNLYSFFINIYDENGFLVTVGGSYENITYTFENGMYDVVISSFNDQSNLYYENINQSYSINFTMQIPIANAGIDKTVEEGEVVTFDGTSSFDVDGSVVSYEWKEGEIVLSTQSIFSKSDFLHGTHTIMLTVTDNTGNSSSDEITITVEKRDTDDDGIPDDIDTDDDNDGMNDEYENANGLNPIVNDRNSDLDNDGATNFEEYENETNPNDENSRIFVLTLTQGWNLISLPLNSSVLIGNLNNTNIEVVRSYQNDTWRVWTKTNTTSSEQALATLEDGYGYWIKAAQETSISIKGDGLPSDASIQNSQWQMMGSQIIDNIDDFFTQNPNTKVIWKYKDNKWYAVSDDSDISQDLSDKNINGFSDISSSEGFLIK